MNLKQAIDLIQIGLHKELPILMIEVEDGSGWCFNYRLMGEKQPRFVDLRYYEKWVGKNDHSLETLQYLVDHSSGYNQEMYQLAIKLRY